IINYFTTVPTVQPARLTQARAFSTHRPRNAQSIVAGCPTDLFVAKRKSRLPPADSTAVPQGEGRRARLVPSLTLRPSSPPRARPQARTHGTRAERGEMPRRRCDARPGNRARTLSLCPARQKRCGFPKGEY